MTNVVLNKEFKRRSIAREKLSAMRERADDGCPHAQYELLRNLQKKSDHEQARTYLKLVVDNPYSRREDVANGSFYQALLNLDQDDEINAMVNLGRAMKYNHPPSFILAANILEQRDLFGAAAEKHQKLVALGHLESLKEINRIMRQLKLRIKLFSDASNGRPINDGLRIPRVDKNGDIVTRRAFSETEDRCIGAYNMVAQIYDKAVVCAGKVKRLELLP